MLIIKNNYLKFALFLFYFLFVSLSFSQNKFKALINSSNHKPIDEIYVMAYKDSDFEDSFFAGSFDTNKIQFNVPDSLSCFFIRVSNLAYELYEEEICKPFEEDIEIILQERFYELDAVVIESFERTEVHVEGSVVEFRLGQILKSNTALTAETVIKSLPELLVNPQGDIQVRGRKIEKIYLYISQNSPRTQISFSELNAITAEQIESVKVDYLLSEISVYLKEKKTFGVASSSRLQYNQGRKSYGSIAQNLRVNKRNTYYWLDLRAGLVATEPLNDSKYLVNLPEQQNAVVHTHTKSQQKQKFFNSKLFVEHRLDSIYSAGLQLSYQIQDALNKSQMYSAIGISDNSKSLLDDKSNFYALGPAMFLQGNYANNWTLTLKAGMFTSLQKSDNLGEFNYNLDNQSIKSSEVLQQQIKTNAYSSSLEGTKQWASTSLNIHIKGNYLDNKTDSEYYQDLIGQTPVDSVFTNQIKEYKIEAEASVQSLLWDKYILRVVSNFVYYDYSFYDTDLEKLTQNKLTRVLPGFSISAPIKEAKYLTLYGNSYMRSPNFRNLIFRNISGDGFSENKNNYELKPFVSYQLGLNYPILPNTTSSFYWTTTDNMNINYPYFSDTGVFEGNRKLNLLDNQNLGFGLSYSNTFWKRIFLSTNVNVMHNSWGNKGEYTFSTNFVNVLGNLNFHYSSNTNWFFNLDYTYSSKQKLSEHIGLKNNSLMNFSVSKRLSDSWSAFLIVNDLLNTQKLDIYALNSIMYQSSMRQDQRNITFGVNYGFNKGFKQKHRKESIMDGTGERIRVSD